MPGNLHVRFGERGEETCPGNGARRFIPTLQDGAAGCAKKRKEAELKALRLPAPVPRRQAARSSNFFARVSESSLAS